MKQTIHFQEILTHNAKNKRALVNSFNTDHEIRLIFIDYKYDESDLDSREIEINLEYLEDWADENDLVGMTDFFNEGDLDESGSLTGWNEKVKDYATFYLELTENQVQAFLNDYLTN